MMTVLRCFSYVVINISNLSLTQIATNINHQHRWWWTFRTISFSGHEESFLDMFQNGHFSPILHENNSILCSPYSFTCFLVFCCSINFLRWKELSLKHKSEEGKVNIESINCENYTQGKNKYASEYRFYIFKVYLTCLVSDGCGIHTLIYNKLIQWSFLVQTINILD